MQLQIQNLHLFPKPVCQGSVQEILIHIILDLFKINFKSKPLAFTASRILNGLIGHKSLVQYFPTNNEGPLKIINRPRKDFHKPVHLDLGCNFIHTSN